MEKKTPFVKHKFKLRETMQKSNGYNPSIDGTPEEYNEKWGVGDSVPHTEEPMKIIERKLCDAIYDYYIVSKTPM